MRLETKDTEIVQRLRLSTSDEQRHVAVAAAEWALHENEVLDADLAAVASNIRLTGMLSPASKLRLEELVDGLDNEYFQAQDAGAAESEFLQKFGKARAISALLFAGSDDSFVAAAEALYEAAVATKKEDMLFALARSLLPE